MSDTFPETLGDAETLRLALTAAELVLSDPAGERLFILRPATAQVRAGKPSVVFLCDRVVTGNEYRLWQQTGNVPPPTVVDAGSNPADRVLTLNWQSYLAVGEHVKKKTYDPTWPCNCINWARVETITGPLPNHHPRCLHYNDSLIDVWRVSYDGGGYVTDTEPNPDDLENGETVTREKMHRECYEQLQEFAGF